MVDRNQVVAIGLLTARDLEVLGTGFKRVFPLETSTGFGDLLRAIDEAESARSRMTCATVDAGRAGTFPVQTCDMILKAER